MSHVRHIERANDVLYQILYRTFSRYVKPWWQSTHLAPARLPQYPRLLIAIYKYFDRALCIQCVVSACVQVVQEFVTKVDLGAQIPAPRRHLLTNVDISLKVIFFSMTSMQCQRAPCMPAAQWPQYWG